MIVEIDQETHSSPITCNQDLQSLLKQSRHKHGPFLRSLKSKIYQRNLTLSRKHNPIHSCAPSIYPQLKLKNFLTLTSHTPPTLTPAPYPNHGLYSDYFPIKVDLRTTDEYTKAFPVLKWYNDHFCLAKLSEIYRDLKRVFDETRDIDAAWRECLRRWLWDVDTEEAVYMVEVVRRTEIGVARWLHSKYGNGCKIEPVIQKISHLHSLFMSPSPLAHNLQVSVEPRDRITETSIVKTAKQMFCVVCMMYDCDQHKMQDAVVERSNQFVHPKNKKARKANAEAARALLSAWAEVKRSGKFTGTKCSAGCYKGATEKEYEDCANLKHVIMSPVVSALIKLGIQQFSYDPCKIFCMVRVAPCLLVLYYIIEHHCVKTKLEIGMYPSQQQYLQTDNFVQSSDPIQQPRRVRSCKKTPQLHKSMLNTIPLCRHTFLNQAQKQPNRCQDCVCSQRGFCIPLCQCDHTKCTKMRIKCTCKDACVAGSCPCYMNDFECDASLCHCKDCGNMEVQCGRQPKLKVGDSGIAGGGLGAYACEDIEKGRLVAVYIGEIIDYQTELLRQVNLRDSSMYNFALKEKAIDARYIGNKARFVNHDNGKLENCRAKVKFAGADYFLCFESLRKILKGQELFFDYDGEGSICKHFPQKYPYIKARTKN